MYDTGVGSVEGLGGGRIFDSGPNSSSNMFLGREVSQSVVLIILGKANWNENMISI
jgi:hypothetical protein